MLRRANPSKAMPRAAIEHVAALINGVGRHRFGAALLDAANRFARVDHCSLIHIRPGGEVRVYMTQSAVAGTGAGAAMAAVAYIDYYHRFDPNRRLLGQARSLRDGVVMRHQSVGDIKVRSYREACYEKPGLSDRLSFITGDAEVSLVAVNFYRNKASRKFSARDVRRLTGASALFTTAAARHIDLLSHAAPSWERWRESLKSHAPRMTGRELDVAARMLSGMTLRESAKSLGIAHSSVVTYRARAYARLGVGNFRQLRELFSGH